MDKKLEWIEFGRGIAALIVVVSHAEVLNLPHRLMFCFMYTGLCSVFFFFVLSGFIIFYVHADDIGIPGSAIPYLWKRLVRIFPTYWLVLFSDATLHYFSQKSAVPASLPREMFLLSNGAPYIIVAWSLRFEFCFYAAFLLLILNRTLGTIVFLVWFCSIVATCAIRGWQPEETQAVLILNPINLFFFLGVGFGIAYRHKLFRLDSVAAPKFSIWMGQISYPMYLSHMTTYFILGAILKRIGLHLTWQIHLAIACLASIAVATFISSIYEKPLLRRLRRLTKSSDTQSTPSTALANSALR